MEYYCEWDYIFADTIGGFIEADSEKQAIDIFINNIAEEYDLNAEYGEIKIKEVK